jgi:hypothetical protein
VNTLDSFQLNVADLGQRRGRDRVPARARIHPHVGPPAAGTLQATVRWNKYAVRATLANPRYTGGQVWNRQRKDEVLLDVQDVTLGHSASQNVW